MQTIRYVFGRKFISDPKLTLIGLYQVIVQRTVRNHFVYSETEGGNLMILHKCTWKIDFKGRHFILKITIWYDERGQFFSSSLSVLFYYAILGLYQKVKQGIFSIFAMRCSMNFKTSNKELYNHDISIINANATRILFY